MDENQFKQFKDLQRQIFTSMIKEQSLSTFIPNFDSFEAGKECFRNYIERFSNYCEMKGIS